MCKLHKMIRDVVGPCFRAEGDTVDLPFKMIVLDKASYETKIALLDRIANAFPTWTLTLYLDEVGLSNVVYFWSYVKDEHDGTIIGALRVTAPAASTALQIDYTDCHKWTTEETFHKFIRLNHHFRTTVSRTVL